MRKRVDFGEFILALILIIIQGLIPLGIFIWTNEPILYSLGYSSILLISYLGLGFFLVEMSIGLSAIFDRLANGVITQNHYDSFKRKQVDDGWFSFGEWSPGAKLFIPVFPPLALVVFIFYVIAVVFIWLYRLYVKVD